MEKVLFVSQNSLERCENLAAVYDRYEGPKEFKHGMDAMRTAEHDGYSVVVCDALPVKIEDKKHCKVLNICHAITGNKYYGLDEPGPWIDEEALAQTDIAIAASTHMVPIVAGQLGIPEDHVVVTGIPRTDIYFNHAPMKKDYKHCYLYLPTFRNPNKRGWLPDIDWIKVDQALRDDEILLVKRHYFTEKPFLDDYILHHIAEIEPQLPSVVLIIGCDVLVTDYSSAMFDGYLDGKPCVLATDDSEEYLKDRPMYFAYPAFYSSRHMHIVGHEAEFVYMMRNAAEIGMTATEYKCLRMVAESCDGNATARVCGLIKDLIRGVI